MTMTRGVGWIATTATLSVALTLPVAAQSTDGAHRGYFAARLLDGVLVDIDRRNADRLFVPASVLKIVTAAAALEHLGADYRWRTRLSTTASLAGDGTLEGDLVIEPGADPTWGSTFYDDGADEVLDALAAEVRGHGITRIQGDLVVDASRFPGRPHPTDRAFGDLPYRLGTPAAALAIDEATVTVRVAPARTRGAPARVTSPDGLDIINLTTTVGPERRGAGTLDFVPVWGTDTLLLRGEYPINEPSFIVPASDPAPGRRVAHRLRHALEVAGVTVDGATRSDAAPAGRADRRRRLAESRSAPLAEVLVPMLTDSHNWYADMLALTLAREVAGSGRFEDGVDVIADVAAARHPDTSDDAVWLEDGSGLSRSNLLTPETVVRVLADAYARPWGESLFTALASNGNGTLEAWPSLPTVAAKTGSLRHTIALAGMLRDGDAPVFFCYFVNHYPERSAAARREIASALERWLAAAATR